MLIPYGDILINLDHVVRAVAVAVPAAALTVEMDDGKSHALKGDEAREAWAALSSYARFRRDAAAIVEGFDVAGRK